MIIKMKKKTVFAIIAGFSVLVLAGTLAAAVVFARGSDGNAGFKETCGKVVADASAGDQEGIAVHGHWVIEVRNADGSLAERREFENSLTSDGKQTLRQLLLGDYSIEGWCIMLFDSMKDQARIVDDDCPLTGPDYFKGLKAGYSTSNNDIILSGEAIMNKDIKINTVLTYTRNSYQPDNFKGFTVKEISPAVEVKKGQQVIVTVTISFS